ncbi:MAG: transposase, partial [Flavobacteriales bacterium]
MSELEIQLKKAYERIHYLECQLAKQQHQIEQLLRQLYGKKSEKLPVLPTLFDTLPFTEDELTAVSPEEHKTTVPSHERKKPKKDDNSLRYKLPEHLRREEVII